MFGAQSMSLRELLAAADVVTLHVPLVAATRGMIGEAELAAMKPGAVLVQAARGVLGRHRGATERTARLLRTLKSHAS